MSLLQWFRHRSGLDTQESEYEYSDDPVLGYTSARKHADRWVNSTCGYCSVGCGMQLGVREGKVVSVRGNPDHPVNRGKLCPKGLAEHYAIEADGRALYPLLRKESTLTRASWDEALSTMAHRFRTVQQKHGPDSVGVISTGQLVTEEFYALGKLVQLGLGTRNYDGNTTLCMSTAVAGYKRSFGSDGPPGAYEDLEIADVILLIGANIAENHPILCTRLEANPDKMLIVVDPRVTKTAMMADRHLPIKPRADLALINAMLRVVIDEQLYDFAYVDAHITGFDDLRASLDPYTLEYASGITGLTAETIRSTAQTYAKARAPFIGWTMGVNHSTKGTETVNAINNLALITGNVGRAGASPFSITGQCNAMGTREAGFASSLPGYRTFESETDRNELAAIWNIDAGRVPTARGLAYPDIIEAAVAGKVRALWIIGTNPIVSYPNINVLRHALANLDFLVVQDGFHPTPTSELAHLVLPAAIWGEKEGTYTNSERRVSKVNKAVEAPANAHSDFEIFLDVAEKLGCREELFPHWQSPADAFEEWRRVSHGRLCDYSGMSYESIENSGGIQWPLKAGSHEDPAGTRRLYADGSFETEDRRARLIPTHWSPFPEQPSAEFPFVLNTGRTVEHWHTRTKTGGISILQQLSPRAWLEMNPSDAGRLNLKPHDRVDIVSARGRVSRVELRVTEIIAAGQVFLPFHFAETNANQITQSAFDPISREPNFKQCAVRIEKSTSAHSRLSIPGDIMNKISFTKTGHLPTLISAFFYFDISFMVWVLFGPMTPFIAEQLHLSATQKGLLTAIPLLGGSFFRPILGLFADRLGGRRVGLIGLSLTLIPLILGWQFATQLWQLYIVGFLLGIAGASFAVALPLAARWYPAEHQGLAMGIAGAGNSGTLIATLFGPRIAQHFGWHSVFGAALVPISTVLLVFSLLARNSPSKSAPKPWSSYGMLLRTTDTWRLCLLYSLTFGGFVGLTSFLSVFFHDQYHLSKIAAGDLTTIVVLSGSFLRPVGGWLADRFGGFRLLLGLFGGVALCLMIVCTLPPIAFVVSLLFVVMGMLGMGNGAVFQVAPQRFPREIEIITGIVGAAGGLGGFFLPSLLGMLKDLTGTYAAGLACFALCTAGICILLLEFGVRWKRSWPTSAIIRAQIFSYRRSGATSDIGEMASD